MFDTHNAAASRPLVGEQPAEGHRRFVHRVSSEMQVTTGQLLVRFDFEQQWLTVGFLPWFDWHVDTRQVQVSPGLILFVGPGGRPVGIKVSQKAAELFSPNIVEQGGAA